MSDQAGLGLRCVAVDSMPLHTRREIPREQVATTAPDKFARPRHITFEYLSILSKTVQLPLRRRETLCKSRDSLGDRTFDKCHEVIRPSHNAIHKEDKPMAYQSVNPYDGRILKTFDELSDAQLETALDTAATCFNTWRHTTFAERAAVVAKAAAIMRERIDEFARPVTLEMGKLIDQARGEVVLSADIIDYYAKNAERFLAPEQLKPSSGEAAVESSPLGVLFGVEPWNFPYYQLARFAAPNLMAGNVVMVKHAGCVPQCAIAFEKLWLEAGAPLGAYTNLLISHDQVDRVIDDPRIKGVALTGSVEAGKSVAGRAGKNLKKSTMELGGSDAFIVLEDADLDKTVKWALWGKMNNTGQCCVAAKRFIVVEELADRFLDKVQDGTGGRSSQETRWTKLRLSVPYPRKRPWCNCWTRSKGPWPRVPPW